MLDLPSVLSRTITQKDVFRMKLGHNTSSYKEFCDKCFNIEYKNILPMTLRVASAYFSLYKSAPSKSWITLPALHVIVHVSSGFFISFIVNTDPFAFSSYFLFLSGPTVQIHLYLSLVY